MKMTGNIVLCLHKLDDTFPVKVKSIIPTFKLQVRGTDFFYFPGRLRLASDSRDTFQVCCLSFQQWHPISPVSDF